MFIIKCRLNENGGIATKIILSVLKQYPLERRHLDCPINIRVTNMKPYDDLILKTIYTVGGVMVCEYSLLGDVTWVCCFQTYAVLDWQNPEQRPQKAPDNEWFTVQYSKVCFDGTK